MLGGFHAEAALSVWWARWIDLLFRFAKIDVLPPSSWRQATVHRTVAFGSVSKLTNEGKPADLQSAAIAARRLKPMVEPAGIEPATLKFSVWRSALR